SSTGALLVVDRRDVTTVVRLPVDQLISAVARDGLDGYRADIDVALSRGRIDGLERTGPSIADGQVTVTDRLALPGGAISAAVTASIADDVGFAGDGVGWYITLLALGTIL